MVAAWKRENLANLFFFVKDVCEETKYFAAIIARSAALGILFWDKLLVRVVYFFTRLDWSFELRFRCLPILRRYTHHFRHFSFILKPFRFLSAFSVENNVLVLFKSILFPLSFNSELILFENFGEVPTEKWKQERGVFSRIYTLQFNQAPVSVKQKQVSLCLSLVCALR